MSRLGLIASRSARPAPELSISVLDEAVAFSFPSAVVHPPRPVGIDRYHVRGLRCPEGGCRFCETLGCPQRFELYIADRALVEARAAAMNAAAAPVAAAA